MVVEQTGTMIFLLVFGLSMSPQAGGTRLQDGRSWIVRVEFIGFFYSLALLQ